jgi:uncharacterized membrane protein
MRSDTHDFARLTNLADGIFAVSMTFLAFTIQVPSPGPGLDGSLAPRLRAMLPQLGTLALSFAVAARIWTLHFKMHRVILRGDNLLLVLNLVMLFGIVLIPFSADVLSTYPLSALSVSIYAANALVMLLMDGAIWFYARTRPDHPTRMMRYSLEIAAVFGSSIIVARFAPHLALWLWALIPPLIALQARSLSRASTTRHRR